MNLPPAIHRTPPHSVEAEQGILGCILLDPAENMEHCIETLRRGHEIFYDLRHQALYQHMAALHETNRTFDLVTLAQRLKDHNQIEACGGLAYLATLADTVAVRGKPEILPRHRDRETPIAGDHQSLHGHTGARLPARQQTRTHSRKRGQSTPASPRGRQRVPTAHDAKAAMGLLIDDLSEDTNSKAHVADSSPDSSTSTR